MEDFGTHFLHIVHVVLNSQIRRCPSITVEIACKLNLEYLLSIRKLGFPGVLRASAVGLDPPVYMLVVGGARFQVWVG